MNPSLSTSAPKSGEGSGLWFVKILSGLLVIVILVVHFIVNHMLGSQAGLMTYDEIVAYYASHLIIPIMEILFVTIVVSHALLGLRSIILDLRPTRKTLRVINWSFIVIGSAAIIYGIWLVLVITQRGMI